MLSLPASLQFSATCNAFLNIYHQVNDGDYIDEDEGGVKTRICGQNKGGKCVGT